MAEEIAALVVRLEGRFATFERQVESLRRKIGRDMGRVNRDFARTQRSIKRFASEAFFTGVIARVAGAVTAYIALDRAIKSVVADSQKLQQMRSRLEALTGSAERAGHIFEGAFDIGSKTGAGLDAITEATTRFRLAGDSIGLTDDQVLKLTDSIVKLGYIGGATSEEMRRGMIQLAQGLSAGVLRGQDLRSVMEQMPLVAREIAQGLGVDIGMLRKLGEQGQLTADKVVQPLLDGNAKITEQFEKMPKTVGQAANSMAIAWAKFSAALDHSLGISNALVKSLTSAAHFIDMLSGEDFDKVVRHQIAGFQTKQDYLDAIAEWEKKKQDKIAQNKSTKLSPEQLTQNEQRAIDMIWKALMDKTYYKPGEGPVIPGQTGPVPKPRPTRDLRNEQDWWSPGGVTSTGGGKVTAKDVNAAAVAYLDSMQQRLEALQHESEMLGLTGTEAAKLNAKYEKQRILEGLVRIEKEKGNTVTDEQKQQLADLAEKYANLTVAMAEQSEKIKQRQAAEQAYGQALTEVGQTIQQVIAGASSAKDALRQLAAVIAKLVLVGPNYSGSGMPGGLLGSLFSGMGGGSSGSSSSGGGFLGSLVSGFIGLFSSKGNAFMGGQPVAFAQGGIVNGPTMFPMRNRVGLMGERDSEAIMPLTRTRGGALGVRVEGAGGGVHVAIHNNFALGVSQTVRAEIAAETPRMVAAAKAAVAEAVSRGGAYRKRFQ